MRTPRSVLIVKPGSLGDIVHALPVANAIRSQSPSTRVSWIVDTRWLPILENHPAVHHLIPFPRESFRGPLGFIRFIRWLRELHSLAPDVAIDLQGLLRSGLMTASANARAVCGLSDAREFSRHFYHRVTPTQGQLHAVDRYIQTLATIGFQVPTKKDFSIFCDKLSSNPFKKESYIVIHPFSRGDGKSLTKAQLHAFIADFASSATIVLVGTGDFDAQSYPNVTNLLRRTTLPELVRILRESLFVVSVDSGPMHLAAATGVPLLGIHTWSKPQKVGPYSDTAWIWQGGEIRRQDLSVPALPTREFTESDARAVARFVSEQLPK